MNAAPFAKLEARAGRAIVARCANGYLVPEGGVALPAIVSTPSVLATVGSISMVAGNVIASVCTESLGEEVQQGVRCSVFHDDQLQLLRGEYLVRDRFDDSDAGMARLELEIAAT